MIDARVVGTSRRLRMFCQIALLLLTKAALHGAITQYFDPLLMYLRLNLNLMSFFSRIWMDSKRRMVGPSLLIL